MDGDRDKVMSSPRLETHCRGLLEVVAMLVTKATSIIYRPRRLCHGWFALPRRPPHDGRSRDGSLGGGSSGTHRPTLW